MVCYTRPAIRMAAVVLVVLLVFGRSVGHFLDTTALVVAITAAAGGAAIAAAFAVAAFLSIRRRRAAAGSCVSCRFRCQHAMTEQPRPIWLASTADLSTAAPRWPDRPIYRAGPLPRASLSSAAPPEQTERRLAALTGTPSGRTLTVRQARHAAARVPDRELP
jgi:hypothetical protein